MEAQKDQDGMADYLKKKERYKQGIAKAMENYNERVKNMPEEDRRFDERQGWREINRERGLLKKKNGKSEYQEQCVVAKELRSAGIAFTAVRPQIQRGTKAAMIEGAMAKAMGVRAGCVDILIFDPPPNKPELVGTMLEMKRVGGDGPSDKQLDFQEMGEQRRWATEVGYGADDALSKLRILGYRI